MTRVSDANAALILTPGDRHPGNVVKAFMDAWHRKDLVEMFGASQITWCDRNPDGGILREIVECHRWKKYRIVGYAIAGDYSRIDLSQANAYSCVVQCDSLFRVLTVIRESAPYTPASDGKWGVNPVSAIRVFRQAELMTNARYADLKF